MAEDEFSELFRETAGRLHAYAVRQVGRDAADDLVSETYAIAWRRREHIGIAALPWLFVVARNVAVFVYYGDALRLGYVPPAVRQAMLVAMKRLPYIATKKAATIDGAACLKVTYSEPLRFGVGQYYCFDESTASILEEGNTEFASITFRSTVTVSDYAPAVPAAVTAQAVSPEASTKAGTPTSTHS